MNIKLYRINDDTKVLNKTYIDVGANKNLIKELDSVHLLMPTTIESPIFEIAYEGVLQATHIYVPNFGRWYFITQRELLNGKLYRITCEEDYLLSWKDKIEESVLLVERCEDGSYYNRYIVDNLMPLTAKRNIGTYNLGNVSTDGVNRQYITIAGGIN